jgi:enoyl-CoA hydratase
MAYDDLKNLRVEIRDAVLHITIDRPKVLNALNAETLDEIERVFAAARQDDSVRGVIVTGGGEKAFVAGADIGELAKNDALSAKAMSERGQQVFRSIELFPKPVIAAVNGFALGGGCELALACHIRIASEKAQLGLPEVSLGVIPGYGGTQRLARLAGKGKALEMILTGDRITAAEAEKAGLVNRVVAPEDLIPAAETMMRTIVSRGPLAVRAAIEAVNGGVEMTLAGGESLEATLFAVVCSSEDMREGTQAFLEKRPASFKGK